MIVLILFIDLSLAFSPSPTHPFRLSFEFLLVVFLPGYAAISAIFPKGTEHGETQRSKPATHRVLENITGVERVGLAFGLSIAIVALLAVVLNNTPWGIRRIPLIVSVNMFTVLATVIAAGRRMRVSETERFSVDIYKWIATNRAKLFTHHSRIDSALNVLLVLGLVISIISVAYVSTVPPPGTRNTEFYLLTEDDDGELGMSDYPSDFQIGESRPITLRVRNFEYETMEYTVVVKLQEYREVNNSTRIIEERELNRIQTGNLTHDTTWTRTEEITPTMTGDQLRVVFLLYEGDAPEQASTDKAFRRTQLHINVSDSA
ncbi:DUF1616 domain-containing protein [Halorarius litoreus]|uniref:DUF1616 domain-containing protein n=1 Tax=Halorarius litoreus TaxID=2962676 RepID=UPI0020CFBAA0|nr:DUF1616 domain-containing protein [Halorarius litoreus]